MPMIWLRHRQPSVQAPIYRYAMIGASRRSIWPSKKAISILPIICCPCATCGANKLARNNERHLLLHRFCPLSPHRHQAPCPDRRKRCQHAVFNRSRCRALVLPRYRRFLRRWLLLRQRPRLCQAVNPIHSPPAARPRVSRTSSAASRAPAFRPSPRVNQLPNPRPFP